MSFSRQTNSVIRLTPCRSRDKGRLLWARIDARERIGALVARVRDQHAAKNMFDLLVKTGREVRILSRLQSEPEQAQCESWFQTADRPALVAVGDTPVPERRDVRQMYVMNIPPALPAALADIEATGKDGLLADIEFFASERDRNLRLSEIDALAKAGPGCGQLHPEKLRKELADSIEWIENSGCARQFLHRRLYDLDTGVCGNCGWCLGKRGGLLPRDE